MKPIKIGLNGAYGKMGTAIGTLVSNNDNYKLVAKLGSNASKAQIDHACASAQVMIDFSAPSSLEVLILAASTHKTKLLVGTTGLNSKHMDLLELLAQEAAVIYAPNTSLGANLIADLAARAALILSDYDAEIIEGHHRYKKDAPSGTAIMLGKKIAQARNIDFDKNAVFAGSSRGVRKVNEIGFSSIRGGGIFGENEVIFAGDNEMISISCRAFSRDAFASGALIAAKWLIDKERGLYSMRDVLDL